jgi:XapX domain-containing protein
MIKSFIGIFLGFFIGAFCRYTGIPSPAPPVLPGALLVLAMTMGYLLADLIAKRRTYTTKNSEAVPTDNVLCVSDKE